MTGAGLAHEGVVIEVIDKSDDRRFAAAAHRQADGGVFRIALIGHHAAGRIDPHRRQHFGIGWRAADDPQLLVVEAQRLVMVGRDDQVGNLPRLQLGDEGAGDGIDTEDQHVAGGVRRQLVDQPVAQPVFDPGG